MKLTKKLLIRVYLILYNTDLKLFAQILIKIVTKDSPSDYRKIIAYIEHGIAMSGSQGVQIHPESISEWEFIVECVIQHVRLVHERANQVKNQEELTMAKIEVENTAENL